MYFYALRLVLDSDSRRFLEKGHFLVKSLQNMTLHNFLQKVWPPNLIQRLISTRQEKLRVILSSITSFRESMTSCRNL